MADVMGKTGPALSATSDMPAPSPAPETPPPAETPAPEAKPAEGEAKPVEAKPAETQETPPEPKKDGISERFSKMAEQRKQAEARADKLAGELETAISAIKDLTGKVSPEAKPAADDQRPKRDAFDNPEAYDSALIEWSGRQAVRVAQAEMERKQAEADKKSAEDKQRAEREELQKTWVDRVAKVKEKHPDFDEVIAREDVVLTPAMSEAMIRSDSGAEIGYYFGQHPEEAARIAAIPNAVQQVMEIGRLAASLADKPNVSHAPAPIKPIGARNQAGPKSPAEMSMEEYAAYRNSKRSASGSGARH